jgi:hypothetical protein
MRRSLNLLASLAIGYVAGAKTGEKNIDELSRSLKALRQTDEFAQVISAARAQVAAMLRTTASLVEGEPARPGVTGDLAARVRYLAADG